MDTVLLGILIVAIIIVAQVVLRRVHWVAHAPIINVILAALAIIVVTVVICIVLGNYFYEPVIMATIFGATMIQINYSKRLQRYQEAAK
ncbi:hypothetical protein [Culicoidibacter larvae]|uniref:Uncharacterized protein n=1 Tax=Culicoidibacter larvae TaxID=2579976 RepID=A0A5R8Q853_9FIRM|nr:hypothetical protein [Culicoidibacter larvae]TLG71237.1 hypothetical protein FEZ08_11320 [Culicoidibacter larvae]